jgi:hypothetical protein
MVRRFFTRRDGAAATGTAARATARRLRRRRPGLEALEPRTLLSFAGSLRQVGARYGENSSPANARSANGTSVAVWIHSAPEAGPHVYAQRFDAQGDPAGPPLHSTEVAPSDLRMYSFISNILKVHHDTAKKTIDNIR